jgi:hypothetical protein
MDSALKSSVRGGAEDVVTSGLKELFLDEFVIVLIVGLLLTVR